MKNIFLLVIGLFLSMTASSQMLKPVKWSTAVKKVSKTEAIVAIRATIEDGWHIYSQTVPDGGPVKTTFSFKPSNGYQIVGKTIEPKPVTKFEKTFDMNVSYFEKTVTFQQKVKLTGAKAVLKGSVEFMVCDDKQCLPPESFDFTVTI